MFDYTFVFIFRRRRRAAARNDTNIRRKRGKTQERETRRIRKKKRKRRRRSRHRRPRRRPKWTTWKPSWPEGTRLTWAGAETTKSSRTLKHPIRVFRYFFFCFCFFLNPTSGVSPRLFVMSDSSHFSKLCCAYICFFFPPKMSLCFSVLFPSSHGEYFLRCTDRSFGQLTYS